MEKFKVKNFEKENPSVKFPWFRSLSLQEAKIISQKLSEKLRLVSQDNLSFTIAIDNMEISLDGFNAEDEGFQLSKVLSYLNIEPEKNVFVNWYQYDDIDEIGFDDLNNYFDAIWYSGPDDIDIFDSTFSWILSISHDGYVKHIEIS